MRHNAFSTVASAIAFLSAIAFADAQSAKSVSGGVFDNDTGAAIAGALVVASSTLLASVPATLPATSATTDSSGHFTLPALPSGSTLFIEIFPTDGHAIARRGFSSHALGTALAKIKVVMPSTSEKAWLAIVNSERHAYSLGPVAFDDSAERAARAWADTEMHQSTYGHEINGGSNPYSTIVGPVVKKAIHGLTENAGGLKPGTYVQMQNDFYGERTKCPNEMPTGCSYTTSGHFINIVDPHALFIGLGQAAEKSGAYFDELFIDN